MFLTDPRWLTSSGLLVSPSLSPTCSSQQNTCQHEEQFARWPDYAGKHSRRETATTDSRRSLLSLRFRERSFSGDANDRACVTRKALLQIVNPPSATVLWTQPFCGPGSTQDLGGIFEKRAAVSKKRKNQVEARANVSRNKKRQRRHPIPSWFVARPFS